MASLITSGQKGLRDYRKIVKQNAQVFKDFGDSDAVAEEHGKRMANTLYWSKFREEIRFGLLQAEEFAKVKAEMIANGELPTLSGGERITRTYFITVRPDENKISFWNFYKIVNGFLSRECFEHFVMAFEQKGTDEQSIGRGFHIHVLAKMTQRSKTEVLRDTKSTFKDCTAENCIQVDICKKRADFDRCLGYIRDHLSNDGHKKLTAEADACWRVRMGLIPLFTEVPSLSILPHLSSPEMGQHICQGPVIMEFD